MLMYGTSLCFMIMKKGCKAASCLIPPKDLLYRMRTVLSALCFLTIFKDVFKGTLQWDGRGIFLYVHQITYILVHFKISVSKHHFPVQGTGYFPRAQFFSLHTWKTKTICYIPFNRKIYPFTLPLCTTVLVKDEYSKKIFWNYTPLY